MAGVSTEEFGVGRSVEGVSRSGEALVEWRSSEQVENGTPSTSPPFWDSDDDNDGGMLLNLFHVRFNALYSFEYEFVCCMLILCRYKVY